MERKNIYKRLKLLIMVTSLSSFLCGCDVPFDKNKFGVRVAPLDVKKTVNTDKSDGQTSGTNSNNSSTSNSSGNATNGSGNTTNGNSNTIQPKK